MIAISWTNRKQGRTALNGLSLFFSISSETFFGQRAVPLLDSLSLFSFSLPPFRSLSPCVSLGEFNFLPLQCLRSPLLSRSLTEAACHFQRVKHAYARVRSTWLAGFTCAQKRRDPTIGVPVERHLRPASWCLFDRTQGDGNVKEGGVDSVHLEKAAVRYVGGETATE